MPRKSAPPRFDPEYYAKVTLNDLVIYSIYYLDKQGSEILSEDIVSACFVLFPKRFSMRKYPQYPDSGIVSRRWSDCKGKGYLRGSAAKGFKITAKGIRRAVKVEKMLGKPMKPPSKSKLKPKTQAKANTKKTTASAPTAHSELKAHARKYVRSIQASDAYKNYQKKQVLNEFDFRSLLLCTMESPPETLTRNLEQFKEYANMHERKDLLKFLSFSEEKFAHMLVAKKKETKQKTRKTKKK